MTPSGYPSLVFRGEYLDDPKDPVGAAQAFVDPEALGDAKVVVLFGMGLGYRSARLREAGARVVVFEPSRETLSLVREQVPAALEGVEVFTDRPSLQARLLQSTMAGQRTVLLVPPAYRRAFPKEHGDLIATMREAESLKRLRLNTLKERFGLILETALGNLGELSRMPLFTALDRPLAGTPAFIVSAGPSLDKNGHLLAKAAEKGAVFTVNTAAPAVIQHGGSIDVLTCVEALDVTQSLAQGAKHAKALAIDLSAAAANFAVPSPLKVAFVPHSDPFHDIARSLNSRALPYGASVATAAFALAKEWGADPIVMVGQDLAYTDGRVYATGTGREHMRAELQGENVFRMTYDDHMLRTFRDKGVKEPGKHRPAIAVEAWGGGTTHTTHDMVLFLRWFETAAAKTDIRKINATEGGARLEGFEEMPLEALLDELPDRSDTLQQALDAPPVDAQLLDALRAELTRHARTIEKAASKCLKVRDARQQRKADAALRDAKARCKVVELHATPTLLKIRDDASLAPRARRKAIFSTVAASARRVANLVSAD